MSDREQDTSGEAYGKIWSVLTGAVPGKGVYLSSDARGFRVKIINVKTGTSVEFVSAILSDAIDHAWEAYCSLEELHGN